MLKIGQIIKKEDGIEVMITGVEVNSEEPYLVGGELCSEQYLKDMGYIIPPKEEKWKPKEEERFYAISGSGNIMLTTFSAKRYYEYANIGNCFQSKEEAQKVADKFKELLKSL